MKPETHRSFRERHRAFEADEPLALALSVLAHQLEEDAVESAGGDHGGRGHGHVVVNHLFIYLFILHRGKQEDPAAAMSKIIIIKIKKKKPVC